MFGLYNVSYLGKSKVYGKDTQGRRLKPLCLKMKPLSTDIAHQTDFPVKQGILNNCSTLSWQSLEVAFLASCWTSLDSNCQLLRKFPLFTVLPVHLSTHDVAIWSQIHFSVSVQKSYMPWSFGNYRHGICCMYMVVVNKWSWLQTKTMLSISTELSFVKRKGEKKRDQAWEAHAEERKDGGKEREEREKEKEIFQFCGVRDFEVRPDDSLELFVVCCYISLFTFDVVSLIPLVCLLKSVSTLTNNETGRNKSAFVALDVIPDPQYIFCYTSDVHFVFILFDIPQCSLAVQSSK
ncbi:hypothetical protein STEG23_017384, partial [Scotinomys teguina]